MKINYNKLLELNMEAVHQTHGALSAYWIIQMGVEKYVHGEELTEEHKNLLLDLGVLELTQEEEATQSIVGPFKFSKDGPTYS